MPLRKTAIAIPDELLSAVDRAARARHESRNRFVTRVLQKAVCARRDAEVTKRLNELFADADFAQAQSRARGERVGYSRNRLERRALVIRQGEVYWLHVGTPRARHRRGADRPW
jgi:hypothetical protein